MAAPPAHAADDPLSFDDPGMHFRPPDGWERLEVKGAGPSQSGDAPPAAVWVFHQGKQDQRVITISIKEWDGDLDGFERSHESELRGAADGVFIDKHDLTKLSNGMPAYWVRSSQGEDIGKYYRRYEYLVFDGKRGIIVTLLGHQGDFEEKDAKTTLGSLYVVVYPRGRV